MKMKTALTIAGSDCSGGAGIQADLKTMTMNGVYAMSAITALTAQNTTGVRAIQESTPDQTIRCGVRGYLSRCRKNWYGSFFGTDLRDCRQAQLPQGQKCGSRSRYGGN